MTMTAIDVQPSSVAGTWYPGDADELRSTVTRLIAEAAASPDRGLRALVSPHAGFAYSGRAAAAAWGRLPAGRFRRVVLLAPSHHHAFAGAAVHPGRGFATPLGVVEIDRAGADALARETGFFPDPRPYDQEHSLEIELPFLQVVDPVLKIVPVLVGAGDGRIAALAPGIRRLDDGETVFAVSSDFTHYGWRFDYLPFPATGAGEVAARLRPLDFGAIEPVSRLDAACFERYVAETGITVCGRGPLAAFLRADPGGLAGECVCYYTSLDVTGDYEHSVSYAAIVFRRRQAAG
jgi:hypothetical protein